MEYGKLIGGAYRIALHNWRLWPFGLFAGSTGGGFNFSYSSGDSGSSDGPGSTDGSFDPDPTLIAALLGAALVLFLVFAVFSVVSQSALAQSVTAISAGEQRGFRQSLRSGRAGFWRMAGLYLLSTLAALTALLVVAVLAGGLVLAGFAVFDSLGLRIVIGVLAGLTAIAGLLLVFLPFVLLLQHAVREVALQGARPVAALRGGWRVLRANPGATLILLLIQQGIGVAAYIALAVIALVLSVPAIVVLIATDAGVAGIAVAAVTAVVVIPAALAAAGAVGTFSHGLWTLGYLRMTAPAQAPPV